MVRGRAKSVTFADGRTITVVGHIHGDRQIDQISRMIDSGQLMAISDDEFNQMLKRIAADNRKPYEGMITRESKARFAESFESQFGLDISDMVRPSEGFDFRSLTVENHANEDFKYVSEALAQPGSRIQFIGFEGSHETWINNIPYYMRARYELLRQFHLRRNRGKITFTQDQLEALILSASTGNVYAYMRNSDLERRVPMFGSEDAAIGAEARRIDPLVKMDKAWKGIVKADNAYWSAKPEQAKKAFIAVPSNVAYVGLLSHVASEVQNMNVNSNAERTSSAQFCAGCSVGKKLGWPLSNWNSLRRPQSFQTHDFKSGKSLPSRNG